MQLVQFYYFTLFPFLFANDFDMSHINHYMLVSPCEHTLFNIKTSSKLIIILNCFISKTNIKYKKSYVLN